MSYADDQLSRQLEDRAEQVVDLESEIQQARLLGSLQGMVTAAAIAARLDGNTMIAMEILRAAGVSCGADMEGVAECDIARLIEAKVNIPGLHAAWQKARAIERQEVYCKGEQHGPTSVPDTR